MTTIVQPFQTQVAATRAVAAEWDGSRNKLRIEDAATGETLAVFSNGEIYGVQAEVPAGHVVITKVDEMPRLLNTLVHEKIVRVVKEARDSFTHALVVTVEVLL